MRRQLALFDYALGAIRRRAPRNAAIGAGLMVVVAMFSSLMMLDAAIRSESRALIEVAPDLVVQRLVAGRPGLVSEQEAAAVEALGLPGVRAVRPRVWGYLFVAPLEGNVVIMAMDPPEGVLSAGRWPAATSEIAIGSAIARSLGARVGDDLALAASPASEPRVLRVVGLIDPATALLSSDLLVTPDETARALLEMPAGTATDLAITLARPEEAAVVSDAIVASIRGARVIDRQQLERSYELTFDARGGFLGAVLVPALLALLVLAWDRLTGVSHDERREIGILKAIGWSTRDVLAARMWESGTVALAGTALGVVLGYLHAFVLGAPGLADVLFGWSALHAGLALAPVVTASEILAIIASVVVPFVAVSVVPAWRAAMLDPDRALRGQ